MNVIISNRYAPLLQTLDIDIIKSMNGEFSVDEVVSTFQNFYFQRMILDITALKDYKDIKTLQKLSIALDMSKVILFLDDSPESSSNEYLSKLISMGIYNFTKNVEGIMYLYNNPNSYRDVAHMHNLNNDTTDASSVGTQKTIAYAPVEPHQVKILGFKNITDGAGATTLIYMLKKQLERNYKVVGIEVDKRDFMFFNDKSLVSTTINELEETIEKYKEYDVILVDVNKTKGAEDVCNQMYYLIEPSIIKLNKLMIINSKALHLLKDKRVILNKSVLSSKDVIDFEYESRLKVFFNIPPLDERNRNNQALDKFLVSIGFGKQDTDKKGKILGLFG